MNAVQTRPVPLQFGHHHSHGKRRCNLCERHFKPQSKFQRYCRHCRDDEEVLKYGDWLPELDFGTFPRFAA